ncbi:aldo/keto reductase [Paenibacillus sp. P96]|uniref:Aldo/keto reductase n=1 Tax=Paenibacillus zeirhizosphaerae TaxID=2987519 RepID=A0ABT9FVY7_9BACL|nr:aldo/keto reductase [Paenibacillus sp. P96]MDP4098696.1 aldo/keto reductase [Paenibacillus sp. P96]
MNNPMFQNENYLAKLERVERLKAVAAKKDVPLPQLALAWLLTRPAVDLVIPGATRPERTYHRSGHCYYGNTAPILREKQQ